MRCVTDERFTVGKALAWRSAIDDDPPYQRPSDRWSLGRRRRFIDSLLNGYDVPKLYFHDRRGVEPRLVYAVVDGKQRLHALWSFAAGEFTLDPAFRVTGDPHPSARHAPPPTGGMRLGDFHPAWRRAFLDTRLTVVLIQDASPQEIDELFFRLNDGVPLTRRERAAARAAGLAAGTAG